MNVGLLCMCGSVFGVCVCRVLCLVFFVCVCVVCAVAFVYCLCSVCSRAVCVCCVCVWCVCLVIECVVFLRLLFVYVVWNFVRFYVFFCVCCVSAVSIFEGMCIGVSIWCGLFGVCLVSLCLESVLCVFGWV